MTLESLLRVFVRNVIAQTDAAPDEQVLAEAREVAADMQRRGMPMVMLELWLRDHRAADPAAISAELQRAIDSLD